MELPLDMPTSVSLDVTYTNGNTFGTGINLPDLNPNDFITNTTVAIDELGSSNGCRTDLDLAVNNPVNGGDYTWSSNPDFSDVLGTGTTLDIDNPGIDMVFVQFMDNATCTIGNGSITLMDNRIVLGIDSTYIICPGDTTNAYCIDPVNSAQQITYNWKPADQLIAGLDSNCPTVGIPEDQSEDFSLILCSTNQFGCTSEDTINFIISTPMELEPFTVDPDSCGSLTIEFEAPGNLMGGADWDFGDNQGTSNELNPIYTYDEPGTYIVSLDSQDGICVNGGVSMEITVPSVPTISTTMDTIIYDSGDPVFIDAEVSNAASEDVRWCNIDGTPLLINGEQATGIPLEFNPEQDTLTIIAKVEDDNECPATREITVIRMNSFPEITICSDPENATICRGETVELFVKLMNFDGEPDDFTFLWSPAECIVDGINSDRITATAEESKTFSLQVTNNNDNMDTTLTFLVTVEDPSVSITPNNGIPGQEGLPTVCEGSSINLSAGPDPNCDFIWDTGATTQDIDVSPTENTTFMVTCITPNGCEASNSVDIEVTPPQCNEEDVFIPTAFSPNEDGVNDRLYVRSKFIEEMEFYVVNRWGQEVWRTTDQDEGWDGSHNGEDLAPDVYAYCIKVTCVNDETYTSSGNVSILK